MWDFKICFSYPELVSFLNLLDSDIAAQAKIIKSKGAYVVFYRFLHKKED